MPTHHEKKRHEHLGPAPARPVQILSIVSAVMIRRKSHKRRVQLFMLWQAQAFMMVVNVL